MTLKVQPAADYWTIDQENLGMRLCYLTKDEMPSSRFYKFEPREYFEWIIKQLSKQLIQ